MPNWSSSIPADPRGQPLPIRRTPRSGRLVAIATSPNLIGCNTHYWGGHTVPCTAPNCPADLEGIPYRWHGYLGAVDTSTNEHFIFEFTAQAADQFRIYHLAYGTLRGCVFQAQRLRPVANSRVVIKTKQADLRELHLPDAPDIPKCMAIIWQLPTNNVKKEGRDHAADRLGITPVEMKGFQS